MTNTRFSAILKKIRTRKGISQAELAEQLFVDRSSITRWENGIRFPDTRMLVRLSKTLDVDVNILIDAVTEDDAYNSQLLFLLHSA